MVQAEQAQAVDHDRGGQLAEDGRRRHPAGADHAHRDQGVEHVEGAEEAAEQVVPADVEGAAEAAGLAGEDDHGGEGEGADREGDEGGGETAGGAAEAGVDRRLGGDQPARGGGEEDGDAPIHGRLSGFA
jgi:hypothetical protein